MDCATMSETTPIAGRKGASSRGADVDKADQPLIRALYESIILVDMQGGVLELNQRALRWIGRPKEECLRRPVSDFISGLRPAVLERIEAGLRNGRFTVMDGVCKRHSGARFPAEISVSRFELGGRVCLFLSIRSLEWRIRHWSPTPQMEHSALQSATAAIVVTDLDGEIAYTNPAFHRLWGDHGLTAPPCQHLRQFLTDRALLDHVFLKLLVGESWTGRTVATRSTGESIDVYVSGAPDYDSSSELLGLVFSILPVTSDSTASPEGQWRQEEERKAV